jgi:hypothetical protein
VLSIEIYIHGLIYIRVELSPRWLVHAVLTVAVPAVGWLAARPPELFLQ